MRKNFSDFQQRVLACLEVMLQKSKICNCWTPGRIASYFEKMLSGV